MLQLRADEVIVEGLANKVPQNEAHLAELTEYLKTLEKAIVQECGQDTLDEWKATEAEWKRKVVDVTQHADLVSPYEAAVETGARLWTMTRHILTNSQV